MDIALTVFWIFVALCSAVILAPFICFIALVIGSMLFSILATLFIGIVAMPILIFWVLPKYLWSKIRPTSKKEILHG